MSTHDEQAEGQHFDRKSLRIISRDHGDFPELARDCVCFANSAGGTLIIGVEDDATEPPPGQRIDKSQIERIRKRIGELTVNVEVHPELRRHANGGDYLVLTVSRSLGVASTTDGRYFLRIGDACLPIVGDDVLRLANERPTTLWETLTTLAVLRSAADPAKLATLVKRIRASDRLSDDPIESYLAFRAPYKQLASELGVSVLEFEQLCKLQQEAGDGPDAEEDAEAGDAAAWLFQCRPDIYDLRGAVEELSEMTWAIRTHRKRIHEGDAVYLWESGPDAALIASGTITSEPVTLSDDPTQRPFYRDPTAADGEELRVWLHVDRVVRPPLTRQQIIAAPELADVQVFRSAQGTNFRLEAGVVAAIGHSYFCQPDPEGTYDGTWYERIVKYEIEPLLDEYWAENPDKAKAAVTALLGP